MKPLYETFNVLVVEDNPPDAFTIQQMLLTPQRGYQKLFFATSLSEATQILKQQAITLVFLDLSLPDSFGIKSFLKLRELIQKIPVIILTGLSDSEVALEALNQGAQDYLVKGEFDATSLLKSIQYSIERKRAEEKILISEEKYRQVFHRCPFPMWICDQVTQEIIEVNDAALKKYGYERQEFLQLSLLDIQLRNTEQSPFVLSGTGHDKFTLHQTKGGERIIVELTSYPINYYGKSAAHMQINDVTDKVRLENELAAKNQQIVKAVLNAQEKERKFIGEELHDNINQILASIKLTLSFVLEDGGNNLNLISRARSNASLAIEEVRRLSKALILPGNLKQLGILCSLEILINDIQAVTQLKIHIHSESFRENLLSEQQNIVIYRIIQEQLNNILKYAQASQVIIRLKTNDQGIYLSVSDNGKGFDVNEKRNGIGFCNISSRAELFNGNVKLYSSPGKGCRLIVILNNRISQPQEAA